MVGWLVEEEGIEPHVSGIDKSKRSDGTFSRNDFDYDHERDLYTCPAGKTPLPRRRKFKDRPSDINKGGTRRFQPRKHDCAVCPLKSRRYLNMAVRKVSRSIHERARDMGREIAKADEGDASRRDRK